MFISSGGGSSSDDATLGRLDKVADILDFGCHLQFALDLFDAIFEDALGIEQTIGVVDELNQIIAEAMAAESHEVDAAVAGRLFASYNIRRNILAETATALNHHVAADVAELMTEDFGTDHSEVVTCDLTGKLGGIADDQSVAKETVMGDVHVFHQQVVVAHACSAF